MELKQTKPASHKKSAGGGAGAEHGQIDDLIGDFGRYQFLIFLFKVLIGATSAFNNLGVTFYAPTNFISYWCANSSLDALNQTAPTSPILVPNLVEGGGGVYYNFSESAAAPYKSVADIGQLLKDFVLTIDRKLSQDKPSVVSYDSPLKLRKECTYLSETDNQLHKCASFQYDTGIWESTIVSEWNLVCDRAWFISVTQSLYMGGFILSYLMFGFISDRYGRWRSMLLGASIEVLSGFGCAFATSVSAFMFFRFLLGLGNAGRSSSTYLCMIEWTGPKWRMHISTLGSIGWVCGYCAMPWISLFFVHFRHMQLFVCFYELIFIIWILLLPESPRWLLTHRKFDEARDVLLMAAKFNGLIKTSGGGGDKQIGRVNSAQVCMMSSSSSSSSSLSAENEKFNKKDLEKNTNCATISKTDTLEPYSIGEFDRKFKRLSNTIEAKEFTKNENKLSLFDLFKWKNLRTYTFILAFSWAVNSFIYYGIALRIGDFGSKNLFVTFTLAGITELPSIAFTIICMKFLPRKTTNVFLFACIFTICAIQIPLKHYNLQWLQQSTMLLAKFFNSCSFVCILYQTIELFPTSIRQTAYSTCSLAGRFGSILAPFIKELSQLTSQLVPPFLYAILSLLEILSIRHLPETKGSDMPDTLLEAEKFRGTDKRDSDSDSGVEIVALAAQTATTGGACAHARLAAGRRRSSTIVGNLVANVAARNEHDKTS